MDSETRTRKWQITINNPEEKGYTHEVIRKTLEGFKGCVYWCMSDEIGLDTGTYHTHVYMACKSAVKFTVMFERFRGAHFDVAQGTSQQNRDYIFKEGKWASSEKVETNLKDTHEEWGEMPIERQGARNDIADLYDMIKQGMTDYEILESHPQYMLNIERVQKVRSVVLEEQYKNTWRDVEVTYIYGDTGVGKTRSIMEEYGYPNVYRVTDYDHPFDSYAQQDVIVFEEFRSSLRVDDMLVYLDGYPVQLKCRYANKVACYHKIFIVSNIPLCGQYPNIQKEEKVTWQAFLRRIQMVRIFLHGKTYSGTCEEYVDGKLLPDPEPDFEQTEISFEDL